MVSIYVYGMSILIVTTISPINKAQYPVDIRPEYAHYIIQMRTLPHMPEMNENTSYRVISAPTLRVPFLGYRPLCAISSF